MTNKKVSGILFIVILSAYILYAGLYIYKTSFIINGERYFTLFDDAMISMRYAKNLASGAGLVWNPGGEKVEGFSNPLWVMYMSIFHLLPVPPSKVSLFIQISSVVFLLFNLLFVKKIAGAASGFSPLVCLGSVILTAFYLPINHWGLQGMEVGVLTLLVTMTVHMTITCINSKKFSPWPFLFMGLGTLIRMDMAIPYVVILAFLYGSNKQIRQKNLVYGVSLFAFFIISQTLFRLWYFGEILPNTYYLKMAGTPLYLRVVQGVLVLIAFIWRMNWVVFLITVVIVLVRRNSTTLLLFCVFLAQMLYSVYVGGDAWEQWGGSNRYICVAMPAFFILFSLALKEIIWRSVDVLIGGGIVLAKIKVFAFIVLLVVCMVNLNAINEGSGALEEWTLVSRSLHVQDNQSMIETALLTKKISTQNATIAVVWAGAIPYFSERYSIDILGKNDKVVARGKSRRWPGLRRFTTFHPGHSKWDYGYSIGDLKPDIVAQVWGLADAYGWGIYPPMGGLKPPWLPPRGEAKEYLDKDYTRVVIDNSELFLRKGSKNILWEKIKG